MAQTLVHRSVRVAALIPSRALRFHEKQGQDDDDDRRDKGESQRGYSLDPGRMLTLAEKGDQVIGVRHWIRITASTERAGKCSQLLR